MTIQNTLTLAQFLLHAELKVGIGPLGGPMRSQRLFSNLGKGRWLASDGAAWKAAAEEVVIELNTKAGDIILSPQENKIVLIKDDDSVIKLNVAGAIGDTKNLLSRVAVSGAAFSLTGENFALFKRMMRYEIPHPSERMDLAAAWCCCVP
jgi:hypothetical protein